MTATVPHPKDVCECGDYRHQHAGGTGRCSMPDDICHGFQPCWRFRLQAPIVDHSELLP